MAYAFNNTPQVVGLLRQASPWLAKPYLWNAGVDYSLKLLAGDSEGFAKDVNNSGYAVGTSGSNGGAVGPSTSKAVRWSNGVPTLLPLVSGSTGIEANAINDAGTIVGSVSIGNQIYAAGWLGSKGYNLGISGRAVDVNNANQVLIQRLTGSHVVRNYDGTLRTLRPLTGGLSYAQRMNNLGYVVGFSTPPAGSRAVLWMGSDAIDLNMLLSANLGVTLGEADAINQNSQILVWGQKRVFVLTPNAYCPR